MKGKSMKDGCGMKKSKGHEADHVGIKVEKSNKDGMMPKKKKKK